MPKAIAIKQRNKPHKRSHSAKRISKNKARVKKGNKQKNRADAKQKKSCLVKSKQSKAQRFIQQTLKQNIGLDLKSKQVVVKLLKQSINKKIVVFIPLNQIADTTRINVQLKYALTQVFAQNLQPITNANSINYNYFNYNHHQLSSNFQKDHFLFINSSNKLTDILDYCKVADIICPVLSCRQVDAKKISIDPLTFGKAFDQLGYTIINYIRRQGQSKTVCLLQDLDKIQARYRLAVKKLFFRFFQSQFVQSQPVQLSQKDDYKKLMRIFQNIKTFQLDWRENRSYMLAQSILYNQSESSLKLKGTLKGDCLNSNQLVHLTGIGDFQVQSIQILDEKSNHISIQYSFNPQSLQLFSNKKSSIQLRDQDIEQALKDLDIHQPQLDQEFVKEQEQDQQYWKQPQDNVQKPNYMEYRKQDQLQFQDQVQYGADIVLQQRYKKYRGLKNFKSSQWNTKQNLPDTFNKIFIFKNNQQIKKQALAHHKANGFAYNGFNVIITLKNFKNQSLNLINPSKPLILSSLLKNQRKVTMLHAKVQWLGLTQDSPQSKQNVILQVGFRRYQTNIVFSSQVTNERTKYMKKVKDQNLVICSFYGLNSFSPAKVLIFRNQQLRLAGQLYKIDPLMPIIKRITLTGYPYKINRRRATVRFMFYNPKDVRYFKPVQLSTKLGLRGNIQQPLGTHGLMKCLFNNHIKANDTVCMHLYKRVFPKFII